jgi:hypothetical protein
MSTTLDVELIPSAPRTSEAAASRSSHRAGTPTPGRRALLAAGAAALVIIVGSYADHWTWTGLTANGQVWDWLELLLLPVAIGTFPLWLRFSGEMSRLRRKALGGAVIACTAFVLAGYLVPLSWTGFRGHTLWNWLTLVVLPITIATAAVWPQIRGRFGRWDRAAAGALCTAWIVTVIGGYVDHWAWTGYSGNTLWEWVKLFLAPIAIATFVVPELIDLVAGNVAGSGEEKGDARASARSRTSARRRDRARRVRVRVLDGVARQRAPHVSGYRGLLSEAIGAHEDVDDATLCQHIAVPRDPNRGHHRGGAEALQLEGDLELVVEARRGSEARLRLGDHQVEAVG